ncbi:hypothetical protein FF38_09077 [Lucilia cuprina]|uniref:5-hydroxyisourate hydrolase n=1 Tax=Lucilia cuprina TaxID=7375 RepID=A0A0L0CQN2_LUCCU|nr:5-hydroxyisourate hydrolase [Lucilia cuprina]KNC33744.1 hypothetical protein FF38_09077 [Lucilia cuprina]
MSSGWERIRLRVETGETLEPAMPKDTRTLSTHILDTSLGKAAVDVPLTVYRLLENQQWQELKQAVTDKDGRASQLLETNDFKSGIYKLQFNVQKYYDHLGVECFYPFIEIVVKCVAGQHYHIPLLLSPFGYTTYRGT